ncbi:hypothetical protein LJB89_01320 [Tyzzerella sp. OttesenSCG-928-J15]|nr:hypothetical protein [Tyzzerella sp. OttesenSCG-928-J15]
MGRWDKKFKKIFQKRVIGLTLFSMSIGMFLVIFMPAGVYLLAIAMAAVGFYLLFVC